MSIVGAILGIGLLIIVHEAGHYFVARWCKMRVDRFSVGFGPSILGWKHGETEFTLGPIPFGGFVQINGMTLSDDFEEDDERAYPNRPVWQRFITIFAGPGTNYIAAVLLALCLYGFVGVENGTFKVGEIVPEYDASGKLVPDDVIVAINGQALNTITGDVTSQKGLSSWVKDSDGQEMELTILRAGKPMKIVVDPRPQPASPGLKACRKHLKWKACEADKHLLGITYSEARERVGIGTTVWKAFNYPIVQTIAIVSMLSKIVFGEVEGDWKGPVGITSMISKTIESGWIQAIELLMMLNVYLGLINLLPLPALDGGRLLFLVYEMTTRRRPNPKVEAVVHMVGIMALLLIMVVVTYGDIAEIFNK